MIVLGGLTLLAWVWLLLGQGRFWRTDQRLPEPVDPEHWPSVAIVVPARDEAAMLPVTLPTLLGQRYPGQARVIVVDDNSTDGTGSVAGRLSGILPLAVTAPGEPPAGWTGKLWAVAHGVAAAGDVDYLLLTDADITHEPDSLAGLVAARRDLVSQMALLRAQTRWERLLVPAFVYFFAMLFPFRWVNGPGRTAAAAGGCVLVRRAALTDAGGIPAIRDAVIDDVALAGSIKRSGGRIWLGLSESVRSVRPYPRLADLWRMVARSAYTQLRHSPWLLAGTVAGMVLVFVAPVAVTVAGIFGFAWWWLGGVAWLIMAGTFVPTLRLYRVPAATAFLLPVTGLLYTLMTLDSARRHYLGGGATWKGRDYKSG